MSTWRALLTGGRMRRQSRPVSVAKRTELKTAVSVGDFRCVASARVIESELKNGRPPIPWRPGIRHPARAHLARFGPPATHPQRERGQPGSRPACLGGSGTGPRPDRSIRLTVQPAPLARMPGEPEDRPGYRNHSQQDRNLVGAEQVPECGCREHPDKPDNHPDQ